MHISNHLSFFIFHHVAIFPEDLWPKTITLIEPVIIEGQKMGKSKGNVISLADIKKKYSADLFRFYIAHGADFGIYMDFREKQIQTVKNHLSRFYSFMAENMAQQYDMGHLEYLNITEAKKVLSEMLLSSLSKAMLSKITKLFLKSDQSLSNYNQREYLQLSFYETFNLIQDYKKFSKTEIDLDEFYNVFNLIYGNWLKLLSLTIPHLTDELWELAGFREILSNFQWREFDKDEYISYINEECEIEFDYISTVLEDIKKILKVIKKKEFSEIHIYTAPKWKEDVNKIISTKKGDFKVVVDDIKNAGDLLNNKQVIPFIKSQIKARSWNSPELPREESVILEDYIDYMENRIGKKIILNSDYDPNNKSSKAIPLKPAIFINI
jgi:leucyl-tRNA synthetase